MHDRKIKLMVIEDEKMLLDIIEQKLKECDIDVVSCVSGEDALKAIDTGSLPDVIWLDYHLRGLDGLEFIKQIKQRPPFAKLPIIVVSNSANQSTIDKLLNAGASKYLLKAQNRLDDIIKVITSLI